MKKIFRFVASLILAATMFPNILAFQEVAVAVTVNSGDCSSNVTSSAGVQYVSTSTDCYLAFTTVGSNVWTPPNGVTSATFLIVAGGGAGGSGAWGGGGGAGGVVYYETYTVSNASPLNLSVGSGGIAGNASNSAASNRSSNGEDSWINSSSTIVAKGGGAGASYAYGQTGNDISSGEPIQNGKSGGSGEVAQNIVEDLKVEPQIKFQLAVLLFTGLLEVTQAIPQVVAVVVEVVDPVVSVCLIN